MNIFKKFMSVFKPVDKSMYEIIFNEIISATPKPEEFVIRDKSSKSVKPISPRQKKQKKYWSPVQKLHAIEVAKQMGLSKATRYLQVHFPENFADLSPSTLQYWIVKDREGVAF